MTLEDKKYTDFSYIASPCNPNGTDVSFLTRDNTSSVRHIHESIPSYKKTPLVELKDYAQEFGVKSILVKDESKRFGLNAFKGLGGSYALCRVVCEELGLDINNTTIEDLQKEEYKDKVKEMEFVSATDGNHGKGISWAAKMIGCKAHIYMPKGSVEVRAQAIRDAGSADVEIMPFEYDDTVRHAAKQAEDNGWYLVQDTSWDGYTKIPTWIIQGYTTMLFEAIDQMREKGYQKPTHVFLQAGVGAMAGGILGSIVNEFKDDKPVVSIVEPSEVCCIYESALSNDGLPHKATGSEVTIMAGLNCGEPCTITWPILRDYADYYFSCKDEVSARGMRVYAAPLNNDQKIISGESGSVTMGILSLLLEDERYKEVREKMRLDNESVILLFNTEGNTDPVNYREVVYDGKFPMNK